MALEQEISFFEQNRKEWFQLYPNKFALVKGQKLIGVFDTAQAATEQGVVSFGLDSFLIRRIEEHERIIKIPAYSLGLLRANNSYPA